MQQGTMLSQTLLAPLDVSIDHLYHHANHYLFHALEWFLDSQNPSFE
jgi:hypothetical protein